VHVVRRAAYQGHAVPATAGYPRGPFDADVLAQPVMEVFEPEPEFPYGATAQNDMQGVPLYRCRVCNGLETEETLDQHQCPVSDG